MAVNVLNTWAVSLLPKEKERMHTSNSIHNLYKCVQKFNKFLFNSQHNNRTWTEILFQLSAQKMMAYVDKELQAAFTHLRETPTATITILNGADKSRD